MFQNLNIRWIVIISLVIGAIYFIMPTYNYYSIVNDPDLEDINVDYLQDDALKLGLDLRGGLYIILELDYYSYLLQQSNKKQSLPSKNELVNLINLAIDRSNSSQDDVLVSFVDIAIQNNIDLTKYYSNLLRSNPGSTEKDIITLLKNQITFKLNSLLLLEIVFH